MRPEARFPLAQLALDADDASERRGCGEPLLDLEYTEDSSAEADMNVVMTGDGRLVEVQATAEGAPFTREELDDLLELASGGIAKIAEAQESAFA